MERINAAEAAIDECCGNCGTTVTIVKSERQSIVLALNALRFLRRSVSGF